MNRIESPDLYTGFKWLVDNYDKLRNNKNIVIIQCNNSKSPYSDFELVLKKRKKTGG